MPLPEYLQAIRQEIYYHPKNYIYLIENKEFKSAFTLEYSNKLKTAPKGYPKDWEFLDLIKNRNYAFGHRIEEQELLAPDFIEKAIELFKVIYPLNRYLNKAVDENIGV